MQPVNILANVPKTPIVTVSWKVVPHTLPLVAKNMAV